MSFETLYDRLVKGAISPEEASSKLNDYGEKFRYYKDRADESHPLTDKELHELTFIVKVLQYLYDTVGSPVNDTTYDIYEEMLVNVGIPRNSSSVEPAGVKQSHQYTNLRGTLDKIYALTDDQERANKSRKSLDEWIRSAEEKYHRKTGKSINLNEYDVIVTSKFDGISAVEEVTHDRKGNTRVKWLTRGDTQTNRATDVTHVMNEHNGSHHLDIDDEFAVKYEVMITEGDFKNLNKYQEKPYKNSRQTAASILNSVTRDYKADYLYPVPLRYMKKGDTVEKIHPELMEVFPAIKVKLGDREAIEEFAQHNRYVDINGRVFRTDGAVITIIDPEVQRVLGRENNINKFEVAYKFTEESAYSEVRDIEFYVSDFGTVTPVLVVNPVVLKGNVIDHITLSNYGRFRELALGYGDTVKVLYDIIPYVTVDHLCKKGSYKQIPFTSRCPICHHDLDLDGIVAKCTNPECPSRTRGRILHYCRTLRIRDIGESTINTLSDSGLLKGGIVSLYRLKKKRHMIELLPGFGPSKTFNIIREINATRTLKDYQFFGAIGIEGMSVNTFKKIFEKIPGSQFISLIMSQSWAKLRDILVNIQGIGGNKADLIIRFFEEKKNRTDLNKLLKEVNVVDTPKDQVYGTIVVSGFRPRDDVKKYLRDLGYEVSDNWKNSAKYLIVPSAHYHSSKVDKANKAGVQIVYGTTLNDINRSIK